MKVSSLLTSVARGAAVGLAALAAFTLLLFSTAEPRVASATGPTTVSYNAVGSSTFVVPAGITSLHVVAQGGAGSSANSTGGSGGTGAQVTADIPVAPGDTFQIEVGLGGGAGGAYGGGVGGGLAGIYTCTGLSASCAVVVAGGGGGGGYFGQGIFHGGWGGDGGTGALLCNPGTNGINSVAQYTTIGGATGTCGAGGAGGAGGGGGQTGTAGVAGSGGNGGNGSYAPAAAGAGGGGAGYYGGGGGGGGWFAGGGYSGGAGGGGGSSFVQSGASNVSMVSAPGTASVTITYSEPVVAACAPGTYSATGNEPCTPAPAGTYVATSGAIAPTLCPVGTSSLAGATACAPVQSLSILGGQGTVGSQDPNTQWSADVVAWDAGINSTGAWHFTGNANPFWRPAYMVSGHPWGQVPGTNTWMNCGPTTSSSECGASGGNVVAFRVRFSIPATLTGLNANFWINSDNAGTYYMNGTQITDRLVGDFSRGAVQLTPSGCVSGCSPYGSAGLRTAALASALQPGDNEMIVIMEDWGGLSGFNFRADITGLGIDPIIIVPPPPSDTTPPVITPTVTGTLGDNGWYTSNVNVSWTVTDPDSTISSQTGCGPTTVSADTASVTFTCTAISAGGTSSQSVTVKRDATAPVATATAAPAPNGAGWNNSDVTVTFTGTDGMSGVASCTAPAVLSTEGAGQPASGTCTDNAGNISAPATATVNIDKTAPTATATAAPAPNGAGWNNTDVTVTFAGTDGLSGIGSCTPPAVLGEGAGQSASGTCADIAGNVSAPASVSNINVDKTAPSVTVTGVTNGASYIVGGVPAAGCGTTDTLSGVATSATVTVVGGPVGSVTATCAGATDKAGNTAAAVTATYTVTYQICAAQSRDDDEDDDHGGNHAKGHESGSTIPVKIRVCDANGQNVGSRSLVVTALGLSPTGSLNDSGKANPGNRFRFDDGKYIFNLSTKGLAPGTYTLDYTIGNDPTVYHYSFTIRPDEKHGNGDRDHKDGKKDGDDKGGKKDGKKDH